jgi:hypothetical protein
MVKLSLKASNRLMRCGLIQRKDQKTPSCGVEDLGCSEGVADLLGNQCRNRGDLQRSSSQTLCSALCAGHRLQDVLLNSSEVSFDGDASLRPAASSMLLPQPDPSQSHHFFPGHAVYFQRKRSLR